MPWHFHMAAFVAATTSLGHSLLSPSPSSLDFSSLAALNSRSTLLLLNFRVPDFSSASHLSIDAPTTSLKIVSRAGGNRPPPGARRPRLGNSRQQSSDDVGPRDRVPINEEIAADTVMLLGEDGKLVGTIPTREALGRARDRGLDLVQMDNQNPPCVKIVQYSKFKYEQQKKKREQQKKSSANRMDLKELKMRYNIDTHDYVVRLKSAQKFLKDGDKVKLIIQFKGRELEFKDLGIKLFERFQEDLGEEALVESMVTKDGRSMSMVLAPSRGKVMGQSQNTEKVKTVDEDNVGAVAVKAEA